jgi:hypothetical protein
MMDGTKLHQAAERLVSVYLEVGKKRVFAYALAWPGWCRSGRTEAAALAALAASAKRYTEVAREAGVPFPPADSVQFEVVERLPGTATTDFGAPGEIAAADREPLSPIGAARLAALVGASWVVFDRVVAAAPPTLRKGPRGGGRDRDQVVDHVLGAEAAYARSLGLRHQPARDDRVGIAALREAILRALRAAAEGAPPGGPKSWPPRYAARRIAWHVLDHAWEIQDRAEPAD